MRPPSASGVKFSFAPPRGARVHIENDAYLLKSLQPTDIGPQFEQWLNEPEIIDGLNFDRPRGFGLPELRRHIENFDNRKRYILGIYIMPDAEFVGFYTVDVNLRHRTAQLTAAIGQKRYWGRNVLRDTAPMLLDHLFAHRGIDKISARVFAKNRRVLFNFINSPHFALEGVLRQECLGRDGRRLDLLTFAAIKGRILPAQARPRPSNERTSAG